MTVRQTPLTARLSPGWSSPARAVAMRSRNPPLVVFRSTSSPTASTSPVNIPFDHHVRTERLDAPFGERRYGKRPSRQECDTLGSEHVRCDIEADEVDHAFVPGGRMHRGA